MTLAPSRPDAHDTGSYATRRPRLSGVVRPVLAAFDRQRLHLLPAPPGTLLDAGAGRGRFVAAARRAGWDARGLEPSARGVEIAASSYGVELERARIEEARVAPASLDAVTLWHVLEHLDDPGGALEHITSWLRPGGTLLIGVPNLASLQARLSGPRWFHLDVPRHRSHFTVSGLHTLLRAHGLEPVATRHVVLEQNIFGMWQSLVNRATRTPSWLFNALKRNVPIVSPDALVTVAALPLVPLAALLELLADVARRGGTVAVVARRASVSGGATTLAGRVGA